MSLLSGVGDEASFWSIGRMEKTSNRHALNFVSVSKISMKSLHQMFDLSVVVFNNRCVVFRVLPHCQYMSVSARVQFIQWRANGDI